MLPCNVGAGAGWQSATLGLCGEGRTAYQGSDGITSLLDQPQPLQARYSITASTSALYKHVCGAPSDTWDRWWG